MTEPRTYGRTESGKVITDADIESMADEAEKGYDVDALLARRGKRGRPPLGTAPHQSSPSASIPSSETTSQSGRAPRVSPPQSSSAKRSGSTCIPPENSIPNSGSSK